MLCYARIHGKCESLVGLNIISSSRRWVKLPELRREGFGVMWCTYDVYPQTWIRLLGKSLKTGLATHMDGIMPGESVASLKLFS